MSQIELVYPQSVISVELSYTQRKVLLKIAEKWQDKKITRDEEKTAIVLFYTEDNNPNRAVVIAQAYLYHGGIFAFHVSQDNPDHQKPFESLLPKK